MDDGLSEQLGDMAEGSPFTRRELLKGVGVVSGYLFIMALGTGVWLHYSDNEEEEARKLTPEDQIPNEFIELVKRLDSIQTNFEDLYSTPSNIERCYISEDLESIEGRGDVPDFNVVRKGEDGKVFMKLVDGRDLHVDREIYGNYSELAVETAMYYAVALSSIEHASTVYGENGESFSLYGFSSIDESNQEKRKVLTENTAWILAIYLANEDIKKEKEKNGEVEDEFFISSFNELYPDVGMQRKVNEISLLILLSHNIRSESKDPELAGLQLMAKYFKSSDFLGYLSHILNEKPTIDDIIELEEIYRVFFKEGKDFRELVNEFRNNHGLPIPGPDAYYYGDYEDFPPNTPGFQNVNHIENGRDSRSLMFLLSSKQNHRVLLHDLRMWMMREEMRRNRSSV